MTPGGTTAGGLFSKGPRVDPTMAQTTPYTPSKSHVDVTDALRMERSAFGAKVRAARAILDLSQDELAECVGLTQRSVHRIE